jgi:hypothetical protein
VAAEVRTADNGGAEREERMTDDSCAARGDIPPATALQPTKTMVPLMVAAMKSARMGRRHAAMPTPPRRRCAWSAT